MSHPPLRYTLPIVLLLLACAADPAPPAWVDPTADDDWSDLVPTPSRGPALTADEVAERVALALADGLPLPQPVLADYRELLAHGDAACPGDTFAEGFQVIGGCTTAEGYTYQGAAGLQVDDRRTVAEDGSWTGEASVLTAPADYVITRPDGTRLQAGGTLSIRVARDAGGDRWSAAILGTWQDDGLPGWLGDGYSGALTVEGSEPPGGEPTQKVDGALTVHGASLQLAGVLVAPETCADGAQAGAVRLRQDDGTWYTLTLDAGCGGCGTLTWDDTEALGEACVDLSALPASLAEARQW